MAYREFYKRADVETPDYTPIARGLTTFFAGLSKGYQERKDLINQYKYSLDYGHFENDNRFNTEYAKQVTRMGKEDFRKSGAKSQQLLDAEQKGLQYVGDQKAQYDRFKLLDDQIGKMDTYYDKGYYRDVLGKAVIGDETDYVDFRNRNGRLDVAENVIGTDTRGFLYDKYTSDWVGDYGIKTNSTSGKTINESFVSPFIDPKTGKPEVTNDHAREFLRSRKDIIKATEDRVVQDVYSDHLSKLKQDAATGATYAQWTKELSDAEIISKLINDPSMDPYAEKNSDGSKKTLNDYMIDYAKNKLNEFAKITHKVDVNYDKQNAKSNGSTFNSKYHTGDYSFDTMNVGVEGVREGQSPAQISGPVLTLMQTGTSTNAGKPINLDLFGSNIFDVGTGKVSERKSGSSPLAVNQAMLLSYESSGKPFYWNSTTADGLIQEFNKAPDTWFKNLEPSMSVALHGAEVTKAQILGDITDTRNELSDRLSQAIKDGNTSEADEIRYQISEIESKRSLLGSAEYMDEDLLNSLKDSGISVVKRNKIVKASESDLKNLSKITGIDLHSKKGFNDEWLAVSKAYQERYAKAKSNNFGSAEVERIQQAVTKPKKKPVQETPVAELKKSYNIKGQNYTLDQLHEMGYTDEQLRQAIKAGTIQ